MGSYRAYKSEANRARFEEARGSAAQIHRLAQTFFASVNGDCPAWPQAEALLKQGQSKEALDFFVGWYLTEIGNDTALWTALTSAHEQFYTPLLRGGTVAGLLRNGHICRMNHDQFYIGMPGEIDWSLDVSYYDPDKHFRGLLPVDYMLNIDQFYPLVDEYVRSGRYDALDIWAAFVDDHCLCRDALEPTHYPCDLGYNAGPLDIRGGLVYFLDYMRWLYRATQRYGDPFPSTTFARALMKNIKYYALRSVFYARANPQNWQEGLAHYLVGAGILLKPFRMGTFLFNEGLRAIENYDVCANLLDGSCYQRDIWYNYFWLNYGLGSIYELLNAGAPEYLTPQQHSWFRLSLEQRAKFLTRVLDYQGCHPTGTRATHVSLPPFYNWAKDNRESYDRFTPWIYTDPMVSTFMDYVEGKNTTPPPFTSDAMPIGGYYYIRSGWTDQDQYALLFAPKPPIDGMRHRAINNLSLHAFGHDLLAVGHQNSYDPPPSPVQVDGLMQATRRVPTFGHKRMWKHIDVPINHRTHTSATFDMVEGVYDNWYGPDMGSANLEQLNQLTDDAIKDVSHRRQVFYLRQQKVWLVIDTITGQHEHDYTAKWYLPTQPVFDGWADRIKAYAQEDILVEPQTGAITTHARHMPNLAIYQIASAPFDYETENIPRASHPPHAEGQGYGYACITQRFARCKRVVGLSMLLAEKDSDQGLSDRQALPLEDGLAQQFTAPDGSLVYVLIGQGQEVAFGLSGCHGKAETAILTTRNGRFDGGLFLGCTSLELQGKQIVSGCQDFELVAGGAILPIHMPLSQVEILPKLCTFSDTISVSMRCADQDVDIHYTLDDSDPTPASPRYTGPIQVRESVAIKAQGFRKGVIQAPQTLHCTDATPLAFAAYEKMARLPGVVAPAHAEQGLDYAYYRCGWQHFRDLILYPESQTPDATGVCRELLDISARDIEQPFGFHYSAYLLAPVSGDYTFLVPDEYMDLSMDAGYELDVYVDGVLWRPSARRYAYGAWSVGLEAGYHRLDVWFVDYRGDAQLLKFTFPKADIQRITFDRSRAQSGSLGPNFPQWPHLRDLVWTGVAPALKLQIPGLEAQTIPADLLYREG